MVEERRNFQPIFKEFKYCLWERMKFDEQKKCGRKSEEVNVR